MIICHLFLSVELIIIVALRYTLFGDRGAVGQKTRSGLWPNPEHLVLREIPRRVRGLEALGLLAPWKLQHLVLGRCQQLAPDRYLRQHLRWSNPIWIDVVTYSPYFVDDQPHPDWLGGDCIVISGTGGEISFSGSGDVEIHESTNIG
jgi:hypothetical protein